jgi:hypothetical protein
MRDHRHALRHCLDGDFRPKLAFGDRQVERLRLVVRPGNRRRAATDMKIHHLFKHRAVKAEVILQRRQGACMIPPSVITPATKQILCHAGLDPASRSIHSGFRLSPE